MNSFVLKLIAIITMFIDHIGYVFYDGNISFFNYIGRFAFPIFAFQICQGYIYTKNLKKYFLRLLLFAIISQVPFMLFYTIIGSGFYLNTIFTLLLGLSCIYVYDKHKSISLFASIIIAFIAEITNCDYGFYGVITILIFYVFRKNTINACIAFIFLTLIKHLIYIITFGLYPAYIYLFVFTIIPVIFICLYNGKKGKDTKYLLYLFYPLHLLLIYGINLIVN